MQRLEGISNLIPEAHGLNICQVLEISRLRVECDGRAKFASQDMLVLESAVKNDRFIDLVWKETYVHSNSGILARACWSNPSRDNDSALTRPSIFEASYIAKLPASNGKVTAVGFCWGGGTVFKFANHNRDLKATYVFYGRGPSDRAGAESIQGPVYGFYAENDARVNETLPETTEAMRTAGKTFEPQIYPGAGHGFMRAGEAPDASEANLKARDASWSRWKSLLEQL